MRPNTWVSSSQASEFLTRQLDIWPLAKQNYLTLESVKTKEFDMGSFTIKVQYNPQRLSSSGAKIDEKTIRERRCFLCPDNLPAEQERLPFGDRYYILCNPYPIFKEHFTIPTREHTDQKIITRFEDFLELTRQLEDFTIFYNGPKSGASAPDHAHFQAAAKGIMPIDNEWKSIVAHYGKVVLQEEGGSIYTLVNYLRNGFVVNAKSIDGALSLFKQIITFLPLEEGETEPKMNLFGYYSDKIWSIVIIPRKQHRPRQFFLEGIGRIITSPGAVDIGGIFITPREEDFNKITTELLRDIYQQVCFSDREIEKIADQLAENHNLSLKEV